MKPTLTIPAPPDPQPGPGEPYPVPDPGEPYPAPDPRRKARLRLALLPEFYPAYCPPSSHDSSPPRAA